ncbi:MAG: MarR family transcriptional regulator [Phototrophicaceae bacterium]
MGFIQASIKNVLNTTKEIRKASGKIAISGAKRMGNLLENGATFFKKIAERYEQSDTATPTEPQTPPTPASVAMETPPVTEATPASVAMETPPVTEATPASVAVETPPVTEATPASVAMETPPVTEATPEPVAVETPPVTEATPEPVEAETATTIAEQVLDEETPAAELNENSLIVYRAIQDAFNQNGETPSQGKIADMTGFSKSTISRHVGLLEEGGYIKRADDKTRKISFTDKKLEA